MVPYLSVTTGTLGAASISSSAPLNVGGFNFANSDTRGLIDELEIFNAALPQASINLIYRALTLGKCNRNDLGCIPPPPGMVSWYPFTPITSQAHLEDHATTNSALNRFGAPTFPAGPIGSVVQFTTGTSYLQAAANFPEHNFGTQPFSIDFYLQGNPATNVRTVVEKMQAYAGTSAEQGWSVQIANGKLQLVVNSILSPAPSVYTSSLNAITTAGAWRHLTITADRVGAPLMYFDGLLDPSVTLSGGPVTTIADNLSNSVALRVGAPTTLTSPPAVPMTSVSMSLSFLPASCLLPGEVAALALTKAGKCTQTPSPYAPPSLPLVCFAPPTGMVGWYRAEETAGPSLNHLAATTSPMAWVGTVTSIAGKVGKALSFGGNGFSKLEAPSAGDYAFATSSFSIDLWLRDAVAAFKGYALYLENDGRLGLHLVDSTGSFAYTTSPASKTITFGQWTHVAATVDRTSTGLTVRLYIDGALVQTNAHALTGTFISNYKLSIGSGQYAWTGDVDEVELFDRVLTDAEVLGIYTADTAGKCASSGIGVPIPTRVPVTVNTSLNPTQGITVGITSLVATPNTSLDVYTNQSVPIGVQVVSAQPDKKIDPANSNIQ